jgi:hypothetical protein
MLSKAHDAGFSDCRQNRVVLTNTMFNNVKVTCTSITRITVGLIQSGHNSAQGLAVAVYTNTSPTALWHFLVT